MHKKEYNMSVKLGSYHRVVAKLLLLPLLCIALMASACTQEAASQWAAAQEASEGQRATAQEAVAGSEFNALFPESQGDFEVVYTQEKIGFVEATLKEDGTEVATLSIFDTISSPETADKYAESDEELDGYPLVAVGSNGTAILVADRFQVQVRSKIADFTEDDRKEWLSRFDLAELEGLE
jgi:hypothetical protein